MSDMVAVPDQGIGAEGMSGKFVPPEEPSDEYTARITLYF
jgi:hypothetical protein